MSNLTERFDDFELQVGQQHDALLAVLTDTNAKLDALLTAFGAAPPTATVSLADVVAAITAQTVVLSDVHLDTQSMDLKLLDILGTLNDVHLDTISIDQKLLRIRNAISPIDEALPSEDKSSVVWSLYRIMDAINPLWPRPVGVPAQPALALIYNLLILMGANVDQLQEAMGLPTGDALTTVLGRLSGINLATSHTAESLGLLPTPADDTALFYLRGIKANTKCGCGATGPDGSDCSDPFESEGMVLLPWALIGGTNQMFATFDAPLPAGITFGTTFGLADDSTELVCADWSQWNVYVASSESQYADGAEGFSRYSTNEWRRLAGSGSRVFSVSERGSISVQLCPEGSFTPGGGGEDGGSSGGPCSRVSATVVFENNLVRNDDTGPLPLLGSAYIWFGSSSPESGTVRCYIDSTLVHTFNMPIAGGDEIQIGPTTGGFARIVCNVGHAYVSVRRCPPGDGGGGGGGGTTYTSVLYTNNFQYYPSPAGGVGLTVEADSTLTYSRSDIVYRPFGGGGYAAAPVVMPVTGSYLFTYEVEGGAPFTITVTPPA